jgi:hypothetical protein
MQMTTWMPLLLADSSPSLRLLVLRELLGRRETDDEVMELKLLQKKDPWIERLLILQNRDGSFREGEDGGTRRGSTLITAQALAGLGYMGLGPDHPAVKKGAEFLFSRQQDDGSWPLGIEDELKDEDQRENIKYHTIPLQTALPLLGLARVGCAADPRSEKAYEWLVKKSLPEGGWPAGMHNDTYIGAAGYRRLAHSKFGCRTNTTAAVSVLALHPDRWQSDTARRGLDLLLAHEYHHAYTLGFEVARITGAEPVRGFGTYYKRYDVGQMLDLSWRIGANTSDERVAEQVKFVKQLQGPYGLWEYPSKPEASRWITFDLLRSLSRLDRETDWISLQPRTPFQAYPKKAKRY